MASAKNKVDQEKLKKQLKKSSLDSRNVPTTKRIVDSISNDPTIRAKRAAQRVKDDKWTGAYTEYTPAQKARIKLKNINALNDASKVAGRAKNVASKTTATSRVTDKKGKK